MRKSVIVRGHMSESRYGVPYPVRIHVRQVFRKDPITVRLLKPGTPLYRVFVRELGKPMLKGGVYAGVIIDDPRTIYLADSSKVRSASTMAKLISHETLHSALADIHESPAFFKLDSRRTVFGHPHRSIERTGLFRYERRKEKPGELVNAML